MLSKYDQVKQVFQDVSFKGVMISDKDRQQLTRKVDVVYKEKFYKIKKLFLIAENHDYFSNLNVKYHPRGELAGKWELFQKNQGGQKEEEAALFRAERIEHLCAWLIFNHLYHNKGPLNLIPNPTCISYNDIQQLYRTMYEFFSQDLNPASMFYDYTESLPTIVSVFVTINFEAEQPRSMVEDYCLVYLNSWGEMFCRPSVKGGALPIWALPKKICWPP